VMGAFGIAWVAVLIYLLTTGKKEKKGMEPFLLAGEEIKRPEPRLQYLTIGAVERKCYLYETSR